MRTRRDSRGLSGIAARLALSATVALAACGENEVEPSHPERTNLRLSGALEVRFEDSGDQQCSVLEAVNEGSPSKSLVFNGAPSSVPPNYVLIFSIFPFRGPGTYSNVGSSPGSKVAVVGVVGTDLQRFEGSAGTVTVSTASERIVEGNLELTLVDELGGESRLSGKWACVLTRERQD